MDTSPPTLTAVSMADEKMMFCLDWTTMEEVEVTAPKAILKAAVSEVTAKRAMMAVKAMEKEATPPPKGMETTTTAMMAIVAVAATAAMAMVG